MKNSSTQLLRSKSNQLFDVSPRSNYRNNPLENNNFINHDKKDSVGICFVGERNLKDFLKRFIKFESGNIKDLEGNVVGTLPGALLFTQGQNDIDEETH